MQIRILQFGAPSCHPCHAIEAKLREYLEERPEIAFRYINIEEEGKEAAELGVFTVPTLLCYIDEKLFLRESGYFSLEHFLEGVERYRHLL